MVHTPKYAMKNNYTIIVHSISHRKPECVPGRPQTDFRTHLDSNPEVPTSNERYHHYNYVFEGSIHLANSVLLFL